MIPKISKIKITAVRGLPELELQLDSKSLIVLGENGVGKSSIVDSLEYFFNGYISTLEGIKGISFSKHGHHVKYKNQNTCVNITVHGHEEVLSRTNDLIPNSKNSDLSNYLSAATNRQFILRRIQLLDFIAATPGERFTAIGNILGISDFNSIEIGLKHIKDEHERTYGSSNRKLSDLNLEVCQLLEVDEIEYKDITLSLNKILLSNNVPIVKDIYNIKSLTDELVKKISDKEGKEELFTYEELNKLTKDNFLPLSFYEEVKKYNKTYNDLFNDTTLQSLAEDNILKYGFDYITKYKPKNCPLCLNKINIDKIKEVLKNRIHQIKILSEEANKLKTNLKQLSISYNTYKENLYEIIKRVKKIENFDTKLVEFENFKRELIEIDKTNLFSQTLENPIDITKLNQVDENITKTYNIVNKEALEHIKSKELSDEDRKIYECTKKIELTNEIVLKIDKENFNNQNLSKIFILSSTIYSSFVESKNKKIQSIFKKIQSQIQTYYDFIHKDEQHGTIELVVDEKKRASAELLISSFGRKSEDPRALTSEGHLDTLGLCIFIAFIKEFNVDFNLVILDDILTTVDASHRGRVSELLLSELSDYQLIITTHDTIWSQQLIKMSKQLGVQNNIKQIQLINWTLENGPEIKPYKSNWQQIESLLENGDKKGAGNKTRQYLEWILFEMCLTTRAKLAIPQNKSLKFNPNELVEAIYSRLNKLLEKGQFKNDILSTLDILKNSFEGNLLSHENDEAEEITIKEVESFCLKVKKLKDLFSCTHCNQLLKYNNEFKILRCSKPSCTDQTEFKCK